MGWGIKIPALGINTGEFIKGDLGKVLSTQSKIAKVLHDPTSWGDLFKYKGDLAQGADFKTPQSRWKAISDGFDKDGLSWAGQAGEQQAATGKETALNTLGQFGGQGVGADARLDRASRWGQASNMGNLTEEAAMNKLNTEMQGVDMDFQIQQGKEMAAAQADAARKKAGKIS